MNMRIGEKFNWQFTNFVGEITSALLELEREDPDLEGFYFKDTQNSEKILFFRYDEIIELNKV